jgi:hypothetical protein
MNQFRWNRKLECCPKLVCGHGGGKAMHKLTAPLANSRGLIGGCASPRFPFVELMIQYLVFSP